MAFEYVEAPEEFRNTLCRIFTDEFMKEHTNFNNFDDFKASSAVFVNWKSDIMIYDHDILDGFVKESTRFDTWEDMVRTACGIPEKTDKIS